MARHLCILNDGSGPVPGILRIMANLLSFVPYAHVADVDTSIAFYGLFGMDLHSRFGPEGEPFWARMKGAHSDLMLSRSAGPIEPRVQSVLFYLHVDDLAGMREQLRAGGVRDGGTYAGSQDGEFPRSGVFFDTTYPFYMEEGEMRVHDPDGYVLLVGQLPE